MKPTPRPGTPTRASTTGRPVMAALELFGRRWALRILWELTSEPVGARDLLSRCQGLSSSVLYDRIRELTEAGLIAKTEASLYTLTPIGSALGAAIAPLDAWSRAWAEVLT